MSLGETTRVLMVDDEPELLVISKSFLEEGGLVELDTSPSAVEALRIKNIWRYDAIVSDYMMPEMDGIEFLKQLREQNIDVPFILFTGRSREDVAITALNAGADFYLKKGTDVKAQYAVLCSFIDHAVSRYKATAAIEHNLKRFQNLVESMSEVVEVVDSNNVIRYANPAVERYFGKKPEEFVGTKMLTSLHEPEGLEGVLNSLLEGKMEKANVMVKARHVDGSIRLLNANITRFINGRLGTELIFNAKEAPADPMG
jgi:PAS domain S-box-containing protein